VPFSFASLTAFSLACFSTFLNHCRQPGEHVRGSWVVDLLLGKS
jgi:hypothetical protein